MNSASSLSPGDVIIADLGDSSSRIGHEQMGKRPCIVISNPRKFKHKGESLEIVIIIPVTSTRRT